MRPIRAAAALAAACLLPTMSSAVDGTFTYVDKKIQERNQGRAEILGSDMQVDGLAAQQDATVNPNNAVQVCYQASGTADKSDADTTKGDFSSADLWLRVLSLVPISEGGPVQIYPEPPAVATPVTVPCKLKAAVKKAGALMSARLSCDVGKDLSVFPGLTPDLVASIEEAFRQRKSTKLNPKTGKLKFSLNGEPTPGGVVPLEPCDVLFPPPAPPE